MTEEKGKEEQPLQIKDLVLSFIGILAESSWQYMGLVANSITGKIHKDMDEAKLAIDTIDLLFENIRGKLREEEIRTIERTIDDLKVNYVLQLNKEGE